MNQIVKTCLTIIFISAITSCRKYEGTGNNKLLINFTDNPIRYRDPIFVSVDTTTFINVLYRVVQNYDIVENLRLDVYLPAGDNETNRAAIIFIHGGAFDRQIPEQQSNPANGTRKDPTVVSACLSYAKRGYVAISASYRRGKDTNNVRTQGEALNKFYEAVYRAAQDIRSALRFVKKNAGIGNIDSNKIFIGGISAGAVTAMNAVYLDQMETGNAFNGVWGPLDGTDLYDYPGYSNKAKGLINLEGAIPDTTYIDSDDCPMISAFGSLDQYYSGAGPTSTWPHIPFHNGLLIHHRMGNLGILTPAIIVHQGYGHGVDSVPAYLNVNLNVTAEWMYNRLQQ